MIFEIFAFFGLTVIALAVLAEMGRKPFLGIAASVILLILSIAVLTDGIQFRTGENTLSAETQLISNSTAVQSGVSVPQLDNSTLFAKNSTFSSSTASLSKNSTTTYTYANIPAITPVIEIKVLLWLILMFISLYGLIAYAEEIRANIGR